MATWVPRGTRPSTPCMGLAGSIKLGLLNTVLDAPNAGQACLLSLTGRFVSLRSQEGCSDRRSVRMRTDGSII